MRMCFDRRPLPGYAEKSAKAGRSRVKSTTTVKKNYEFRRMYAKGKSGVSSYLVVYYRKNRLGHNRLASRSAPSSATPSCATGVRRRIREILPPESGEDEAGLRLHRRRPHKGRPRGLLGAQARV